MIEIIPIFGIVFGIGMPTLVVVIWIVLRYRRRRQFMELHHAERMAAIERGMELPPLPIELIDGHRSRRRRSSLLPGLVWFFIGLAMVVGTASIDEDIPLIGGLIPLGIGLAYLIYYFAEGRKLEARLLEADLAERATEQSAPRQML
jgi:hypothetical protein